MRPMKTSNSAFGIDHDALSATHWTVVIKRFQIHGADKSPFLYYRLEHGRYKQCLQSKLSHFMPINKTQLNNYSN